jgi:hypothetical protein
MMTTTNSPGSTGAAPPSDPSTSELIRALTDDVRALVQQEVRTAQDELTGKAKRAGSGAAMLGGAAVLGALAAGSAVAAVTRAFESFLPRPAAALLTTSLCAGGAAVLASAGVAELRRTLPLAPEQAVSGLREDLQAARASSTGRPEAPR